jgi:hypothetical protein
LAARRRYAKGRNRSVQEEATRPAAGPATRSSCRCGRPRTARRTGTQTGAPPAGAGAAARSQPGGERPPPHRAHPGHGPTPGGSSRATRRQRRSPGRPCAARRRAAGSSGGSTGETGPAMRTPTAGRTSGTPLVFFAPEESSRDEMYEPPGTSLPSAGHPSHAVGRWAGERSDRRWARASSGLCGIW